MMKMKDDEKGKCVCVHTHSTFKIQDSRFKIK